MNNPLVTILLVVYNGEKYIRHCLKSVFEQTYQPIEVVIFDNASTDKTMEIAEKEFKTAKIFHNDKNIYIGPAFNRAFDMGLCRGEYILLLCVDVILDKNFILEAVGAMESDKNIGAIQAKIFKFDFIGQEIKKTNIIDTVGFRIFKSRRVINLGHGEKDEGQFEKAREVFSYEGAAGFFRKNALESVKFEKEILDNDYEWMVDDLDLGWRLRLMAWKNYYVPTVICFHDRKTTKRLSIGLWDFIEQRKKIMPLKRKLDYRNMLLTLIKNELTPFSFNDLSAIFWREIKLFVYVLLFEWTTLPAIWEIIYLLPTILRKRRWIMKNKKINAAEMRKYFV